MSLIRLLELCWNYVDHHRWGRVQRRESFVLWCDSGRKRRRLPPVEVCLQLKCAPSTACCGEYIRCQQSGISGDKQALVQSAYERTL